MLKKFKHPFFGQRAQKQRHSLDQTLLPACPSAPFFGDIYDVLDIRLCPVVPSLTPVGLRYAQDLPDVPTGVVVGVERRVPVLRRPTELEVVGGGRYGVLGGYDVRLSVP